MILVKAILTDTGAGGLCTGNDDGFPRGRVMKDTYGFPLRWPDGWPRTDPEFRSRGSQFKQGLRMYSGQVRPHERHRLRPTSCASCDFLILIHLA